MIKDHCIYSSSKKSNKRADNSFAQMVDGSFVQIVEFLVHEENNKEYTICKLLLTRNAVTNSLPVMKIITRMIEDVRAVQTHDIKTICVCMTVANTTYICPVPNLYSY